MRVARRQCRSSHWILEQMPADEVLVQAMARTGALRDAGTLSEPEFKVIVGNVYTLAAFGSAHC
jgi:hypothetical protein